MGSDDSKVTYYGKGYRNPNCPLARNGVKPYRRCSYCELKVVSCLGIQNNVIALAIIFLALLFLVIEDPLLIRINIAMIAILLVTLGFKINTNLDDLANSERRNKQLNVKLTEHSNNLETQVKERTIELEKMAIYDGLTGLVNRQEFEKRLESAIDNARAYDEQHVLCFIDLDRFKIVNDTCGHVAGDELLRQLTPILKHHIRESDTAARFGGDEFGILLSHSSIEEAKRTAERIRHSIENFEFVWEETVNRIGASIGVIGINRDSEDIIEVLAAVDDACYKAKELGRNRVQLYEEDISDMERRHGEKMWVHKLQRALDGDSFVLYFQPIFSLGDDSESQHYEVLIRMQDETGLIIPPSAFLPSAERYSFMPKIDRWVIRNALNAHAYFSDDEPTVLSINISGASFSDEHLSDYIKNEISNTGVSPEEIIFEVTETSAIGNLDNALKLINELKSIGCRFALDDFGSGLSSFSYLKNLPVDFLKIDGRFVKNMLESESDFDIVKAMNQIGHTMGKKTIAEFVENTDVRDALEEIGIDFAQGFGLGEPAPLDKIVCERLNR